MSLREARLCGGRQAEEGDGDERRARVVRMSFRRERSTFETLVSFSGLAESRKPMAAVGQIAAQFSQ